MTNKYFCLVLLGFCGCANAVYDKGMSLDKIPDYTGVYGLPAIEQSKKHLCGYACFASVALYYRAPLQQLTDEAACRKYCGKPFRKYCGKPLSATQLVEMAGIVDLKAFAYKSSMEDLKENLSKGRPMIVLLNSPPRVANWPAFQWAVETSRRITTLPHWVVVAAMNSDGQIILHDPRKGKLKMHSKKFMKQWDKQSNIAVLIGNSNK